MALTLNTSHPLYANLKMLIGVNEANALVDLVTPSRAFTPHANAVFGTGSLGRYFGVRGSGANTYGAGMDKFQPANNRGTLLVVTSRIGTPAATAAWFARFIGETPDANAGQYLPTICVRSGNPGAVVYARDSSTGAAYSSPSSTPYVSAGPRMLTATHDSGVSHALYIDGNETPEVSGGKLSGLSTIGYYNYIGGAQGYAAIDADIVWLAWFDKVLTPGEISGLYASLGADNTFALVEPPAADTAPPNLSAPSATATGTTTASGSVTTDEANGTLYWLASANATETVAAVKAGSSQAVAAGGAQSVIFTGLAASTSYYPHYLQTDSAGNDSTVASGAAFTTGAAGDATAPTLSGAVTFTQITQTGYTASWPAGADNVAVTGYEYQIGGTGGAWTDAGNNLSAAITGRTAGTTETVYVRAYDAAARRSTPAISGNVTLLSPPQAGITVSQPLKNNLGTVWVNQSGIRAAVLRAADLVSVYETAGLTTNGAGMLSNIADTSIIAGQQYHVALKFANGGVGITGVVTAS